VFLFKTGIADEYVRHGTLSLFACINLVSGKISHKVLARNRSREFIEFLSLIESTNPVNEITMTLDNYKTHTSKATGSYLDTIKKKFKFVFTPIHASWLNAIENFFSRITRNLSLFNFFWFSPIFQGKSQIPMKFCRLYLLAFDKSIVLHCFSCIFR